VGSTSIQVSKHLSFWPFLHTFFMAHISASTQPKL